MDDTLIDGVMAARGQASDAARPGAVAVVHAAGHLTARERIEALLDPGSAVEYGILSGRRLDTGEWIPTTGGVDFAGAVDGQPVVASSTDFTDHGGGYGAGRLTRLFSIAYEHRWPVICFADGGGSRAQVPGRNRGPVVSLGNPIGRLGLFDGMAELSGWVPTMSIVSGPSFAGHASIAGFSDFLVATRGSAIGMGGPPLVEAALGLRLTPQELAPVEMHDVRGGIDLLVDDEPAAIAAVKRYLSYYRNEPSGEPSATADGVRSIVPNVGTYDMHGVIDAIVDDDGLFELRPNFARSLITGLARMGGRSVGVLANQPNSPTSGAIDAAAADKIQRFVELCDAYGYPLIAFVDTPGFVIGSEPDDPNARPGMTRHHARPLIAHHHRTVPLFSVQIRRGGGLGSFAMTGYNEGRSLPLLRLAWPTVELGLNDGFTRSVRERNSFDDVVDPAETRGRILAMLRMTKRSLDAKSKRHPIDTW
ncbi:MAG: hypothetical protein O3B31_15035 [Chloroflexi bacterium]|nr:hypothetical protein [Chloroflexota bacterium]